MNNLGEVIGVATFGVESGQSLNFAVSVLQIKKLTQNKNIPVSDMQINACETPKLKRAVGCFSQNDFQNGFRLLNEEIQNNPSNHLAYYYRGLIYDDQKKYKFAVDDYKKFLSVYNTDDEYLQYIKARIEDLKPFVGG